MRRATFNSLSFIAVGMASLAGCASTSSFPGSQQGTYRAFPQTALRGDLEVVSASEVRLNGKPTRLSPGARIRGANNMVQLSGGLIGQRLVVNYTVDAIGQMHDVWVPNDAERAVRVWPRTREESQGWLFDPNAQRWTRP